MRANMHEIVSNAVSESRAIPAISIYDFTSAEAIVSASEELKKPVILLVPPKVASRRGGMRLIRSLRQLVDASSTEICLQLDHADDLELITFAVEAGVDAVLADGSALPMIQNAHFVSQVRKRIGNTLTLEAELGAIAGDEDISGQNISGEKTDPHEISSFLNRSKAELLAVAVGNVHGNYKGQPQLDWPLIERIREQAATVPLVLHGASGIPDTDLARVGKSGIGKVNFNTELRTAIFEYIAKNSSAHAADGMNLLAMVDGWGLVVRKFTTGVHNRLLPAQ